MAERLLLPPPVVHHVPVCALNGVRTRDDVRPKRGCRYHRQEGAHGDFQDPHRYLEKERGDLIPALAKSRRKTGGEDNHGGKSSLVCELVGPIDGIF